MKRIFIKDRSLYNEQFLRHDLLDIVKNIVMSSAKDKTDTVRRKFDVDLDELLTLVLDNLKVTNSGDDFIVYIDPDIRFDDLKIETVLNTITYGNRSIQGCDIIYGSFNLIEKNIVTLYTKWLES